MYNQSRIFVACFLYLVVGLVFTAVTPPFQVADENAHFFRAFHISDGGWVAERVEKSAGGALPRFLGKDMHLFADLPFDASKQITREEFYARWHASTRWASQNLEFSSQNYAFTPFSNTALYSPVPYLPQVVAIQIAKLISLNTFGAMYLARILAGLVSALLLAVSLYYWRSSPRFQLLLFFAAATPMALFQAFSVSADAFTNALALFVVSLSVYVLQLKESPTTKTVFLIGFAAFLLAWCKSVYIFISIFSLGVLIKKKWRRWSVFGVCLFILAILPAVVWGYIMKSVYVSGLPDQDISPDRQLLFFQTHYSEVLGMFIDHLFKNCRRYVVMFVGYLGWLDTVLHRNVINGYLALFGAALVTESQHRGPNLLGVHHRLALIAAALATSFMIVFSLYLSWTPVGVLNVHGLQGRYFIPVAPLVLLALPPAIRLRHRWMRFLECSLLLAWCYIMWRVVVELVRRYWLL